MGPSFGTSVLFVILVASIDAFVVEHSIWFISLSWIVIKYWCLLSILLSCFINLWKYLFELNYQGQSSFFFSDVPVIDFNVSGDLIMSIKIIYSSSSLQLTVLTLFYLLLKIILYSVYINTLANHNNVFGVYWVNDKYLIAFRHKTRSESCCNNINNCTIENQDWWRVCC